MILNLLNFDLIIASRYILFLPIIREQLVAVFTIFFKIISKIHLHITSKLTESQYN